MTNGTANLPSKCRIPPQRWDFVLQIPPFSPLKTAIFRHFAMVLQRSENLSALLSICYDSILHFAFCIRFFHANAKQLTLGNLKL